MPVSLPCGRISHLQLVDQNFVPQIDHFVTILPYYRLCKMSKNANAWPIFIILFFKDIWIYFKLIFLHCSNQKIINKRHKRPCSYYPNSMAVFNLPLKGDLVFKLNPGPVINSTPRVASILRSNSIRRNTSVLSPCNSLTMCLSNIRSLRNKTAVFADYVCETKVDLFAITETWLCPSDDAIRNEFCPVGYMMADHSRTGRRGGGTALVYRNSLTVKKIGAGEKTSFEFSEWTVQSASHNLRIIVIYRPPYSDEHRVTMSTFFAEFADYSVV